MIKNFFSIYENVHNSADQVPYLYFYKLNSKKSAISAVRVARAAKFSYSKNHRDLKINIFIWKFAETFLNIKD